VNLRPPKTGGPAPDGICSWGTPENYCAEPAAQHVFYSSDLDNQLLCDRHLAHVKKIYVFFAVHVYDDATCDGPNAIYLWQENVCVLPDAFDGIDVTFAEHQAIIRSSQEAVCSENRKRQFKPVTC
jgi:hypothetical protein